MFSVSAVKPENTSGVSIGVIKGDQETTFDADTGDWEVLEQTLLAQSEGVARRLRDAAAKKAELIENYRKIIVAMAT